MLALFGAVFTASFFDSLNPTAMAQLIVLLAAVKNKHHIWYFIVGMGIANVFLGLGVYYGIVAWIFDLFENLSRTYPVYTTGGLFIIGVCCIGYGLYAFVKTHRAEQKKHTEKDAPLKKTAGILTRKTLFCMGAAFCFIELTSAVLYFGFLAFLAGYYLAFPAVVGFMILYSTVFVFPMVVLYFGYSKLKDTQAIMRLEQVLGKVAAYIVPVAVIAVGVFFVGKIFV